MIWTQTRSNLFGLLLLFGFIQFSLSAQPGESVLLGSWDDPTIIGSSAHDNRYNEIWGFAINGFEYAILGSTKGTHIIDVTNPADPTEAFFVPGRSNGPHIIHRDYHDYQGYLYAIADEGSSSLQIMDLNSLPDTLTVVYDSQELIVTAHNLFIDTSSAIMYLCFAQGGTSGFSPLRTVDLSNPLEPAYINSFNTFGTNYTISQVHDAFVVNDTAFLNCGPGGLVIADFKSPSAPVTLSILRPSDYPQAGYNHSGWISNNHRYYYMADENHGLDIKVVDLQDIANPTIVHTFNAEAASSTSIPHNLIVSCDRLYVSYYYDGYQVYDISNPALPNRIEAYDTYLLADGNAYKGAWGVFPYLPSGNVLVSDMQTGLFVFESQQTAECQSVPTHNENTIYSNNFWKVYPTLLSKNEFRIENLHQTSSEQIQLRLMDMNGSLLWHNHFSNGTQTIKLDQPVPPGFYTLILQHGNQIQIQKMIFQ